ncbi:MAG: LysE family translocator [Actinomycetota bacterium]|nr:LysE family translocator [Actinomycetota bacterium]
MPEPTQLFLFSLAALALLVIPGPSVLYIVTRSIDQGRAAGLVSVAGIHLGTLVHVGAAAAGLSALILSSAVAYSIVKYAGAAYLIYLGFRRLTGRDDPDLESQTAPCKLSKVFWQGVVVNVLNPKTALFFLAFVPQFIDPARGSLALQIGVLGALFVLLGMLSDGTYALAASAIAAWIKRSTRFEKVQRYGTGGIFVTLGVTAALSGSGEQS